MRGSGDLPFILLSLQYTSRISLHWIHDRDYPESTTSASSLVSAGESSTENDYVIASQSSPMPSLPVSYMQVSRAPKVGLR